MYVGRGLLDAPRGTTSEQLPTSGEFMATYGFAEAVSKSLPHLRRVQEAAPYA